MAVEGGKGRLFFRFYLLTFIKSRAEYKGSVTVRRKRVVGDKHPTNTNPRGPQEKRHTQRSQKACPNDIQFLKMGNKMGLAKETDINPYSAVIYLCSLGQIKILSPPPSPNYPTGMPPMLNDQPLPSPFTLSSPPKFHLRIRQ